MAKAYLLTLVYPTYQFPVGLFKSAQAALDYAAEHPPVHADNLDSDSGIDLGSRWSATPGTFEDYGQPANREPNGYVIQEFDGDMPTQWARVQPYDMQEAVLPSSSGARVILDRDQELEWE